MRSLLSQRSLVAFITYLLYQPLFLSFWYVSFCSKSIYPTMVFLRDHYGNKVSKLFCVIPASYVPYHAQLLEFLSFLMNLYFVLYVINIIFICDNKIYLLTLATLDYSRKNPNSSGERGGWALFCLEFPRVK